MSRDSTKGAITYEQETVFGEDVPMSGAPLWRIPVLDRVDVSGLTQAKMDSARVVQYRNACTRYIPGPKGGSIRTRCYLTGHGSTTASTITLSKLAKLFGYAVGNSALSATAGTSAGADWDTDDGTVAASNTFSAGSIAWFGVKGDTRADGQPSVIQSHVGTQMDLLVGLPAAPANTDAVYTGNVVYPSETPSAAAQDITGLRLRLTTANLQYDCHGCFARSFSIQGTDPNNLLVVEIEWGVSWWEEVAGTFPSTVATDEFTPLPNAAGSFFFQVRGTKTRVVRTYRTFSIDVQLGVAAQEGPGGVDMYQSIVGAKRVPDVVTVTWTEDSEPATVAPALAALWDANQSYHLLVGFTMYDGQRVAFYSPSVEFIGERPNQVDGSGINRVTGQVRCCTGTTVTTELEASAWRIGIG